MNNKIQEIVIEADKWMSNTANWRHITGNPNIIRDCKFAELIIRECVEYLRTTDFSEVTCGPNAVAESAATDLLNLFGIE